NTNNASATTIAQSFAAPNTAGNLIVAAVSWDHNAAVACSDTQGNTYTTLAPQYDAVNFQSLVICYASGVKAGPNTVTPTFAVASLWRRLLVHEYTGIVSVSPVDVVARNVSNGTTAVNGTTSTAATTTVAGDLIFGAVMDGTGTTSITAGTGFTQRQSVN